jgi:thiopurine S-methyltransferase
MQADFWHERWASNQLGFHQAEVNAHLRTHWPELGVDPNAAVFVPLCGKSLDMVWLHEQGHPVIGVELSPIACRDFFAEQELAARRHPHGALETWSASGHTIHCGDFFALSADDLTDVEGVFDRGSLVALPPEMRRRYAEQMTAILPVGARVLLLAVDYDQREMNGPPHSVPADEIEALFGAAFEIERLAVHGPSDPPPHFRERGLRSMSEVVWRLDRRARPA